MYGNKVKIIIVDCTGQHACVQVISNYFSLSDLEEYTKPQGVNQQPRLQATLLPYLHMLLTTTHIHPIKVSNHIASFPGSQYAEERAWY